MGFRQGGYCYVWSTEPSKTGKTTKVRMSSGRVNKETNQFEQDFSGFCTFIGKANEMARGLRPKDRIKLLACDVCTKYEQAKQKEYVNYKVFDFEMADNNGSGNYGNSGAEVSKKKTAFEVDDGEPDKVTCPF